jgi:predicted phosphodiesterase
MKIRLLSDIHQEFYEDKSLYDNKGEDVLVLAGDIAVGAKNCIEAVRKFALGSLTKHVIYVSGNHEYYGNDMDAFNKEVSEAFKGSNVHFLNPGAVSIEGVTFIGATLWSNFGQDHWAELACRSGINDFYVIPKFSTGKCADLYEEHEEFIKGTYAATEGKKVIVTHFLPDHACISQQYRGPSAINHYFANNLGNWISGLSDTPLWLFGHTHDNVDLMIGDTRTIANPYGYNQNHNYKEMIIEV